MWTAWSTQVEGQPGIKIALGVDSSPLSTLQVTDLWQQDAHFRAWFNNLLAEAPFAAFRWEIPAVTTLTADRPFEFVLLDRPELAVAPDPHAFAEHFDRASDESVIAFPNLGKDAILVVPCPRGPLNAYSHLGAFVRHAPDSQIHALWQTVGGAMQSRLGIKPVWLSTAGAGVAWLHVRLDDRPKYYRYMPYREPV